MKKRDFTIPILGLKDKVYDFQFELDKSFFDTVDQPLIADGDIVVNLKFDKRHEPYVLNFHVSGTYMDECDRCAANISIPIEGEYRLFVEIANENLDDETEVIYMSRDQYEIHLYNHIYDFVHLTLPMVKRCESPADLKVCDQRVNEFMDKLNAKNVENDPRWAALKNLKQ